MNGLIGILNLLISDETLNGHRHSLEIAKTSAVSLLKLLSEILTLSSMDAGKIRRKDSAFSLDGCVDVHLRPLMQDAAEKGLTLTRRLAPEIPEIIHGDQARLGQIIVNLVSNAIKFTERGQIDLEVSIESISDNDTTLLFAVRDTGIGISPEHQEVIFNPFVQADSSSTRNYGGVGLGLSIVQRLVDILDGRIWVESQAGKGSTFYFTAPFGIGMEAYAVPLASVS